MAREHLLCSALGVKDAEQRTFTVYKCGRMFKLCNDRGHSMVSHLRVTEENIRHEIHTVYGVQNVRLIGSVREGVIASTWPITYECCTNCQCSPTRRTYGNGGYCGLCYNMIKALDALRAWDRAKPESFLHVPKSAQPDHFTVCSMRQDQFEVWRQEQIRQAEKRLSHIRSREEKRSGRAPVGGLDLEEKLACLLHAIRHKAKYPHNAKYIEQHFDHKQRQILYGILDEIEDHVIWRGFSRSTAYDLIRKYEAEHEI